MAGSSNGTGPRQKPGPAPRQEIAAPPTFCVFCCQLFKKTEQENILPAITWVPIAIPGTGLWVTVPTCMGHLEVPKISSLIT